MSGFFGGGTTTTNGSSAPWTAQQPYLQDLLAQGQQMTNSRLQSGPFTGSLYSPINGMQTTGAWNGYNYANGSGQATQNEAASAAMPNMNAGANFGNNAQNILNTGVAGPNGALMGDLSSLARGANAAPQVNQNATLFASNPEVQNSISAVNQQIGQTLNEQTLPGINRKAAMGGGLNSSRAGAANAQAQEGAAIAEGSADANIQNNAYNSGLGAATSLYNTGLASQLGAANAGLSQGLGYEGLNAQTQLNANQQLGAAGQLGLAGAEGAGSIAGQNYALAQGAGGVVQNDQNASLQNAYAMWQNQNGYAPSVLGQYAGLIGGNYGGTQNQTVQAPTNVAGSIAGLGTMLAAGLQPSSAQGGTGAGGFLSGALGSTGSIFSNGGLLSAEAGSAALQGGAARALTVAPEVARSGVQAGTDAVMQRMQPTVDPES